MKTTTTLIIAGAVTFALSGCLTGTSPTNPQGNPTVDPAAPITTSPSLPRPDALASLGGFETISAICDSGRRIYVMAGPQGRGALAIADPAPECPPATTTTTRGTP